MIKNMFILPYVYNNTFKFVGKKESFFYKLIHSNPMISEVKHFLDNITININCQDINGNTPLHHAIVINHMIAIVILSYNADPTIKNNDGIDCQYFQKEYQQSNIDFKMTELDESFSLINVS